MTQLKLEVGKIYSVSSGLVQIICEVPDYTVEYNHGARFASRSGLLFDEEGNRVTLHPTDWRQKNMLRRSGIVGEAYGEENRLRSKEFIKISLDKLDNSGDYYASDDPRFSMRLGEVYLNRLGLPEILTSMEYGEDDKLVFFSHMGRYDSKGRSTFHNKGPTLRDLIYMRRPLHENVERPEVVKKIIGHD